MTEGESYRDLGGLLPDETERERGRRRVAELRERLERSDRPCLICQHGGRYHHGGLCHYPIRGEDCGPCAGCDERSKEQP